MNILRFQIKSFFFFFFPNDKANKYRLATATEHTVK